ncbi:MFS transporter [Streptomyces angustmyceticus]|nr:MFS transporter [Streptomyces angustmyceticus]
MLITAARLGDRYGYQRLFVLGAVVFMAGSVAAGCAPDATFLIAARLVQGAGSGLVAPQVLSIIQVAVPAARRPRALGLFGATVGVASLAGPLTGGLLVGADLFGLGWRSVFLVTVPVALVSLAGATVLSRTRGTAGQRMDGLGVLLTSVGFGALVLPLTLGGEAGWPWWTWATLAVSAAVLGYFALTLPHRPNPLVHPSLFRDRRARAGVLLVFAFNSGVPSFTYLLFLHLQSALGYPALTAALTSAPFAAAAVLGSRSAPALARRHGSAVLTVSALVLAGTALALAPLRRRRRPHLIRKLDGRPAHRTAAHHVTGRQHVDGPPLLQRDGPFELHGSSEQHVQVVPAGRRPVAAPPYDVGVVVHVPLAALVARGLLVEVLSGVVPGRRDR